VRALILGLRGSVIFVKLFSDRCSGAQSSPKSQVAAAGIPNGPPGKIYVAVPREPSATDASRTTYWTKLRNKPATDKFILRAESADTKPSCKPRFEKANRTKPSCTIFHRANRTKPARRPCPPVQSRYLYFLKISVWLSACFTKTRGCLQSTLVSGCRISTCCAPGAPDAEPV